VDLEFSEDALVEIAEKAISHNTGARGLRGIMEQVLRHIMFEIPSREDVEKCTVTAQVVKGEQDIDLVLRDTVELKQANS
jgi:ATP-dependent Clp protease ATP-binding subunit ClpX